MKLTGKCKEEFEIYIEAVTSLSSMYSFRPMSESCKSALIIEFFDSVGIYVEVAIDDVADNWDAYVNREWIRTSLNNRTEATSAAIEKANEIYNNQ